MSDQLPKIHPMKLTRAGHCLAESLERTAKPVLTQFEFFQIIWEMYQETSGKKLYLRHDTPTKGDYMRLRSSLKTAGVIGADRDYGRRIIRVLTVSDLPAEDIICLIDRTCHVSHLSAMQQWGLTDRSPKALMLTRPDRKTAAAQIHSYMTKTLSKNETNPYPLRIVGHPPRVRRRTIRMYESKTAGAFLRNRGTETRLSTIGQTFLDMLQKPELCGGMSHILDVWEEHAKTYLDEIVEAVDTAASGLVKSRAGYILEERLDLHHPGVEHWKKFGQRGSSRRLDPAKAFAPTFSETWMISLNA